MLWVLLLIGAGCLLVLASIVRPSQGTRSPDRGPAPAADDPIERIEQDPAGALAEYGTSDDAARLQAQGIDLTALGYEPPEQ